MSQTMSMSNSKGLARGGRVTAKTSFLKLPPLYFRHWLKSESGISFVLSSLIEKWKWYKLCSLVTAWKVKVVKALYSCHFLKSESGRTFILLSLIEKWKWQKLCTNFTSWKVKVVAHKFKSTSEQLSKAFIQCNTRYLRHKATYHYFKYNFQALSTRVQKILIDVPYHTYKLQRS